MEFEQGDVILCTVDRIVGTTVFLKIDGTNKEGSMVFSEVSPGRIRNIRDFVVPKKTIVCKVLNVTDNNIELSLRRVKEKERKEVFEQYKIEKSYASILKSVLKEKTNEIISKIKESSTIFNFLEESKENSSKLEKFVGKESAEKILEILKTQRKKTISLKKNIEINTNQSNGLTLIKEILQGFTEVEIKYIAAGKYAIKREDESIKKADQKIKEIFETIEQKAKKYNIPASLK